MHRALAGCMLSPTMALELSPDDRRILASLRRSTTVGAGLVRRARVILALAAGQSSATICATHGVTDTFIAPWQRRVVEEGLLAVGDRPRSGRPDRLDPRVEAKSLATTHAPPPAPLTHGTTRRMAALLGVSHVTVARMWQRAGLKPHRLERYLASDDPDVETKAADAIGLYLAPPTNAVVFLVDETTAMQALDRLDPVLPLSPGRADRHGFAYKRHGTLSLYAALNVATGDVEGMTAARHTSAQCLRVLDRVITTQSPRREIHLICDNLSAHNTKAVADWLRAHPRGTLHDTPTYSAWRNHVELWCATIARDMIARGIVTSVADLRRTLMQYIRPHHKRGPPIRWAYRTPTHRVRAG